MANIEQVLMKPLITEKSAVITEKTNRYGFQVALKANKHQIKNAVEKFYNVKVLDVKTQINPGKMKRFGANVKKSSKTKKAFVQLSEGQKIEFFKDI
ncbi:MAG: 50S ribosomal protein L23 [Bacteriovoracaceae bacterium]